MLTLTIALALSPLAQVEEAQEPDQPTPWELLSSKYDRDGDGRITASEYPRGEERFARLDLDGDGVLTRADAESVGRRRGRGGAGDRRRPPRTRPQPPKTGLAAPDFSLPVLHWGAEQDDEAEMPKEVTLAAYAGRKPVALIFGSYT